jgi:hypothetical protein
VLEWGLMNSILFKVLLLLMVVGGVGVLGVRYGMSSKTATTSKPLPTSTPIQKQSEKYFLTLSSAQKEKLKSLIASDKEAKTAYGDIEAVAQEALKDTPHPIDVIQSSGIVKGDSRKTDSLESAKDADKVYALGFAYTVTGDIRYAKKAQEFSLSWAKKNTASKDPINQRLLEPLYIGYDLIKPTMSDAERKLVDTWMVASAHTLIDNIKTSKSATSNRNNHNSHLLTVVGMAGFSTNDQELIDYAISGYKRQIKVDLNPDGSSYDFHQRDALYYHVFTLEPLLTLARIAQMNGTDLFHYQTSPIASQSATLQKSIDFLLPYATGKKTHAEWIHSTAPFDKTRADAGDEQFQPGVLFNPTQAYPTLELYYYFNPDILPLALKLSGSDAQKYPDFLMVYLDAVRY